MQQQYSSGPNSGDRPSVKGSKAKDYQPLNHFKATNKQPSKDASKELNGSRSNTALKNSSQQLSKLMDLNNQRKPSGVPGHQSSSPKQHQGAGLST